jgi:hypothetical protein
VKFIEFAAKVMAHWQTQTKARPRTAHLLGWSGKSTVTYQSQQGTATNTTPNFWAHNQFVPVKTIKQNRGFGPHLKKLSATQT